MNYEKLWVWQQSTDLAIEIMELFKRFNHQPFYNQVSRCAISIPSNIAEGVTRDSQKDKRRMLIYAIGSAAELQTQIMLAQKMQWLSEKQAKDLLHRSKRIYVGLNRLKKRME
ncbi:four helix bundle protein [Idiomarina seosinensis]|uniref:four helix bundle protein n=1 Tax=Idiomarina seosinensis TaxID=281739 RepID=UPI00384D1E13